MDLQTYAGKLPSQYTNMSHIPDLVMVTVAGTAQH